MENTVPLNDTKFIDLQQFNVYWPSRPTVRINASRAAGWLSRRHQGCFFFRAAVRLEFDEVRRASHSVNSGFVDWLRTSVEHIFWTFLGHYIGGIKIKN